MEEIGKKTFPVVNVFLIVAVGLSLFIINPVYCLVLLTLGLVFIILKDFKIGLFALGALSFTELASLQMLEAYHVFLLCSIATSVAFIIFFSRDLNLQFRTSPVYKWMLVFLTIVLFSGLYAENIKYWQGELYAFLRVFIIFFLLIQGLEEEKSLYMMAKVIVLALFISSLFSFLSLMVGNRDILPILLFRFVGNLADPNDYAMTLCGALPLAIFFVKTERTIMTKLFFAVCGLTFVFFVIITQSRGGVIAALISILLILTLFKRKLRTALITITIIILVLNFVPAQVIFHRIIQLYDILAGKSLLDPSFSQRLALLRTAVTVFMSHPIFGVGANNFIVHSVRFLSPSLYTHNMFTEVAADLGLLGLIPFAVIVFSPFAHFPEAIKQAYGSGQVELADFIRLIRISLIGMLIASLFLSCQSKPYLWVMLALAYATWQALPGPLSLRYNEYSKTSTVYPRNQR